MGTLLTDAILTKGELAKFLKLSERSIDRFAKDGKIPKPFYLGKSPRWDSSAIKKCFLDGFPGAGAPREIRPMSPATAN
jgi:predicted DNA-binding transcriptional regulator AlpA